MNRRISFLFLAPLLALTGLPASGSAINFRDLHPANACVSPPDPNTPGAEFGTPHGCWSLQKINSDGTIGGSATGDFAAGLSSAVVTGSDANSFDSLGNIDLQNSPLIDAFGSPIATFTQFTTVISDATPGVSLQADGVTLSGDLTVSWKFTTLDAGSFYDPAGYILCPASPNGFPSGICGLFQLTTNIDAFSDEGGIFSAPYEESGSFSITLSPGDVFGAYVLTADNLGGAGTIEFSDPLGDPIPEPASFLLIGGGLVALGMVGQKARRRKAV